MRLPWAASPTRCAWFAWADGHEPDGGTCLVTDRDPTRRTRATWVLIETVGFGLIGIVAIALPFPVVARRRPM